MSVFLLNDFIILEEKYVVVLNVFYVVIQLFFQRINFDYVKWISMVYNKFCNFQLRIIFFWIYIQF